LIHPGCIKLMLLVSVLFRHLPGKHLELPKLVAAHR
jgi:hypothetical protein